MCCVVDENVGLETNRNLVLYFSYKQCCSTHYAVFAVVATLENRTTVLEIMGINYIKHAQLRMSGSGPEVQGLQKASPFIGDGFTVK